MNCNGWLIIPCACCTALFLIVPGIFISACNLPMSDCIPAASSKCCFRFQRSGNFPPSVFIQTPLSYLKPLHRLTIMSFFFFAPSLSVTPLPPLLLSPWAMHTLTGIPRCLTPCLREGTDIIPTCIPHCASSIVHWGIYVGITFPRKPCQRHLRNNSLSNFICQEGVMRSSFKTNRQVAFFYITLSS